MPTAFQVTEVSASRLVVTMPGWSIFLGWVGALCGLILVTAVFTTSLSVRRVMAYHRSPEQLDAYVLHYRLLGLAISTGILLLFVLLFYSSGSIELNRSTGTASMSAKMTAFLPAQTRSMQMTNVDRATLDQKPNSRRIRLSARSGQDLGFPLWSDRPGQQKAVDAINSFLRVNP